MKEGFIRVPLSHFDNWNNSNFEYLVLDYNLDKDEENLVHSSRRPNLEEPQEVERLEVESNQ